MASYALTQPQPSTQGVRSITVKRAGSTRAPTGSYTSRGTPFGSASPVVESWVESWGKTASSKAASVKRSVASSPTETRERTSVPGPAPSNVVMGFDAPSISTHAAPGHQKAVRGGLLSKALTTTVEEGNAASSGKQTLCMPLLSPVGHESRPIGLPGLSSIPSDSFFPEVDRTLLEQSQERHEVFRSEVVVHAYLIAGRAYAGQQRHDGASLLSHCVLTALTLADYGLDEKTVAAGLLADALRNDDTMRSQLEEFMPSDVVGLVDRVTTISQISEIYRDNRDGMDDEKLRQMMLAMEDVPAVLVTLAYRMHEMAVCHKLPPPQRSLLAQETLDIYSVVANRLGCWCIKAELEDSAFRVLHPAEYESVRSAVRSRQDPAALEATVSAIKAALDERGIRYEDISGRTKNLYSIWCKMRADGVDTIDTIFDIIALRVVVSGNKHDCYFAQRAVQQLYRCMPERSKDFIRLTKKANGYQSLHETIYGESGMPVEVQIRTHKMHYIAEYGFAAHWKYKENLDDGDQWVDKEVQYKKWLTNYKLGVHDKKVRPSGSDPTDGSLKSLGAHLLDVATQPEHASKVDPFLMHDRFKLTQPDRRTVRVMLQTQDSVEQREVGASVTAGALAAELNVAQLPGYVLTVNQRLPEVDDQQPLRDGDLVQVLPLVEHLGRSPPDGRGALLAGPLGSEGGAAASSAPTRTPAYAPAGVVVPGAVPRAHAPPTPALSGELDVFGLGSEQPVTLTLDFRNAEHSHAAPESALRDASA